MSYKPPRENSRNSLYHPFLWHMSLSSSAGVPQPQGRGPYRAAQQEVSGRQASKASSAAPHGSPSLTLSLDPSCPSHPRPWKNCLPRYQSLVPKKVGDRWSNELKQNYAEEMQGDDHSWVNFQGHW